MRLPFAIVTVAVACLLAPTSAMAGGINVFIGSPIVPVLFEPVIVPPLDATGGFPSPAVSGGSAAVANVWMDTNGGTCTRQSTAGAYVDAQACSTVDAAWDAASAGDQIRIRPGTYATAQTITGPKASTTTISGDSRTTTKFSGGSNNTEFSISGTNMNMILEDLELENPRALLTAGGTYKNFDISQASNVAVRRVDLHDNLITVGLTNSSNLTFTDMDIGVPGDAPVERSCSPNGAGVPTPFVSAVVLMTDETNNIVWDNIRFQKFGAGNSTFCTPDGAHLETLRYEDGVHHITVKNSVMVPGSQDNSGRVFITSFGAGGAPHDLVWQNMFFGASVNTAWGAGAGPQFQTGGMSCLNFEWRYVTFTGAFGPLNCSGWTGAKVTGTTGYWPSDQHPSCAESTRTKNVWQRSDSSGICAGDVRVNGSDDSTSNLGFDQTTGVIQSGSPLIDAGETTCATSAGAVDYQGGTRPNGSACDVGFDELGVP